MGDPTQRSEYPLPVIQPAILPTVADQVFEALQKRILTLELPPRQKISEAEVGRKMGVSRQPVREAFKRLAKMDFLTIRPQSGTMVSLISEEAVRRAHFIRSALEIHTCRTACDTLTEDGRAALADLIAQQQAAIDARDPSRFHRLDDEFHQRICALAGVGYVWDVIHDCKAHMDRIRMLSLNPSSQRLAMEEHVALLAAICARDKDAAAAAMTKHLSRILILIEEVKAQNHSWFKDSSA